MKTGTGTSPNKSFDGHFSSCAHMYSSSDGDTQQNESRFLQDPSIEYKIISL